ncbi:hypothetical protein CBF31_01095 [Vagococcus fessus]|uniref:Uncharacterized protein n=1 Tax=Vagococcus fessus TaxID=120370 RepID=A0A430ADG9_9ENTE|nr:hypothetical protein CBF31_01095 [Vagococcus fessus]
MVLIIGLIVLCEVLFWVAIVLGLTIRYIFKKERLGFRILSLIPLLDLILLLAAGYDMYHGATATPAHALAGIYIGVSVVFGKSMIEWADERFAYYIMKTGDKPVKLVGIEYAKHQFKGWQKHVLAFILGAALLILTTVIVGDPDRTKILTDMIQAWLVVLGIDLIMTLSYFIWKKA